MEEFPRTSIEGVSVARLLIGINWFLGFSHTSQAKDRFINEYMTAERIAPIIEVFLSAGVDGMVGTRPDEKLMKAIAMAEDRTGRRCITLALPTLSVADGPEAAGENARILDAQAATGATFCLPHQQTTDALLDRTTRTIRRMDRVCTMIRDRGMIPGLSTHMPETVPYADEMGLDVATYVQIYNAAGFLMQVELDWVHRIIWNAKRPVIVIKPLAAGRLMPLAGLAFTWATIRDKDMVCVGTQSPDEAREVIEISLSLLERRAPALDLQRTRSKQSVEKA
ncbi:MAG TPA: hypothetical protein VM219_03125 [Phycisphaerae bacterium]|nr:hypothetical protein [Phycisphaerae bacterium]